MSQLNFRQLRLWLGSSGIELSETQTAQSRTFLETLLLWNRKMNLVSQERVDEIISKHLADSFFAASVLHPSECVADIGSGAGFPGIPCAILRPEATIVLFEANQRRASFLLEVVARCRLEHVTVIGQRIQDYLETGTKGRIPASTQSSRLQRTFTTVTARALWKLDQLVKIAATLLEPGGRVIAMKGPNYATEITGLDAPRFEIERVIPYELPDSSRRHLIVLRFT